MARRSRCRAVFIAVAAVGVLTGCGSTVSGTTTSAGGAAASVNELGGTSTGADSTPGGVTATAGGPTVAGSTSSGLTGTGGTSSVGTASRSPRSGTASGGTVPVTDTGKSGPGITATTISVGLMYSPSAASDNSSVLGTDKINPGDERGYYNAVINYVNGHGGVAGRKLTPVWFRNQGYATYQNTEQAGCAYWTQDHHVFAVLGLAQSADGIISTCTQKAGVADINSEQTAAIPETYRHYANFVDVSSINLVRMGTVTIAGLAAQGYFKGGWNTALAQPAAGTAKLGVITYDLPNYHAAISKGIMPAAKAAGVQVGDVRYVSGTDAGQTATDEQNAILKFQSEGITHVVLLDGSAEGEAGIISIYFATEAQSAHYYPRLGLNTQSDLITAEQGGFWTDQQVQGSLGVNWFGIQACAGSSFSSCTKDKDPAYNLCRKIMNDANVSVTNPNASLFAVSACDGVWFLQAAVEKAGNTINLATFIAAVNQLGTSFDSPFLLRSHFTPAQHDGVGAVQYMKYDGSCRCFSNSSGVIDVG